MLSWFKKTEENTDIPVTDSSESDVLCDRLNFTASEAYKLLRTNLMFSFPDTNRNHIVGITSSVRGEGKTTTSINLAYTLAQMGFRVLLIDGDMRLPSVSKRLNIESKTGLSNVLAGLSSIDQSIQPSGVLDNLYVLPAGTVPPNPSELLASNRMKQLLCSLSETIKFIIIDLPPVNVVSDALIISNLVDTMLITVRKNLCDKKSLDACVKQMKLANARIAGFVFNDADDDDSYYGKYKKYKKYYRHYYSKNYKDYGYYKKTE